MKREVKLRHKDGGRHKVLRGLAYSTLQFTVINGYKILVEKKITEEARKISEKPLL